MRRQKSEDRIAGAPGTSDFCLLSSAICFLFSFLPRIMPFARLDRHVLAVGGQTDGAIACLGSRLIGGVTQTVLIAQFLLDLAVDRVDRHLLGDFEKGSTGLL